MEPHDRLARGACGIEAASLDGPQASPKGLRHGFGVAAVSAGVPLNLVQRWLGRAQLTTTAIYADAVGTEEKDIARQDVEVSDTPGSGFLAKPKPKGYRG